MKGVMCVSVIILVCILLFAGCAGVLEKVGINFMDPYVLAKFDSDCYIKSRGIKVGGIAGSIAQRTYEICNERGCAEFECIWVTGEDMGCIYQRGNDCTVMEERIFSGNAIFDKKPEYEIRSMQSCLERFVRVEGNHLIISSNPEVSIILQLKKCEFDLGDGYYISSTSKDIKQIIPLGKDIESCSISNRSISNMTENELIMELDYLLNDFEESCILNCMPDSFVDMVRTRRDTRIDELYVELEGMK